MFRILLTLLFFLSCSGHYINRSPSNEEVTQSLVDNIYEDVRYIALKILEMCPPEDCTIVGLGRSPTPILAFLETIYPESTRNLPLSNFRFAPSIDPPVGLKPHLESFLGDLNDTKIVLFDFAYSGESLMAADYHLSHLLAEKNVEVYPLALTNSNIKKNVNLEYYFNSDYRYERKGLGSLLDVKLSSLDHHLQQQLFDVYSEYYRFPPPYKSKPKYNQRDRRREFIEAMRNHISEDEDLDVYFSSSLNRRKTLLKEFAPDITTKCLKRINHLRSKFRLRL